MPASCNALEEFQPIKQPAMALVPCHYMWYNG